MVLLGWVFVEQVGLPIPSVPLLLASGALAGMHRMNFFAALAVAMFAAICADFLWYQLGRTKGIKILQLLCKISLEPDSCVRKTEGLFSREGSRSLIFAKFLPGLGTVAPPHHEGPAQVRHLDQRVAARAHVSSPSSCSGGARCARRGRPARG